MKLQIFGPLFYDVILTMIISLLLEILRIMINSDTLHTIVEEGLNVKSVEVDDIYND